jgi:hypothetical protein
MLSSSARNASVPVRIPRITFPLCARDHHVVSFPGKTKDGTGTGVSIKFQTMAGHAAASFFPLEAQNDSATFPAFLATLRFPGLAFSPPLSLVRLLVVTVDRYSHVHGESGKHLYAGEDFDHVVR